MKKILPIILVTLMLGCQADQKSITNNPGVTGLKTFESCESLTDFLMSKAGPEPTTTGAPSEGTTTETEDNGSGAEPTSAPTTPTVEEADIVKQEGNRLYVVNPYSGLLIYDVSDAAAPKRVGQIQLSMSPREMYVKGTTVAVIGDPILFDNFPEPVNPVTKVSLLDVSNPASVQIIRELILDGYYSDSRKVGDAIYLALQKWLPAIDDQQLLSALKEKDPCKDIYVPVELDNGSYGSYPLWNLVGLSLENTGAEPTQVSVIGSWGSVVYSTPEHFYLTSYFFEPRETGIYLFDLDPATAAATPRANAFVPGTIVNQFSMDETDGIFRVASTSRATFGFITDPVSAAELDVEPSPPPPPPTGTKNYLTTFDASDGSLDQLGQIDTIVPGESITAVRFLGETAYVSTAIVFDDPLVILDLSNPSQPRILGDLELPGVTNYLQVWGDDRLIAIGSGGNFFGNVLLNLFDVSDLANPKLIEQEPVEGAFGSEAQFEHLAFSFFEDKQIVAFPVYDENGSSLRLFSVNRDTGFTPIGSVSHDDLIGSGDYSPVLRRSLDISNLLYSVSDAGLKVNAFNNLTTDIFEELFPGFTPPSGGICGCSGDVCFACPESL